MSADDRSQPKSAFAPFNGRLMYPDASDVVTNRSFPYFHSPEDKLNRAAYWYQGPGFMGPAADAMTRCFGQIDQSAVVIDIDSDENIANCVTISTEEVHKNANLQVSTQPALLDRGFSDCVSSMQCALRSSAALAAPTFTSVPAHFSGQMPAPASVMPLLIQPQIGRSENLPPRQFYYHKRHHPSVKTSSTFDISASELKNKTRFSATGASGQSTVVRDCKMSLSSSPPSPSAGSLGGSLSSSISRSHFKPIPSPCQLFPSTRSSITALPHSSPAKKVSASPTSASVSPSSRSSTSSSSGLASRKRRADEENAQRCHLSSGYSSTSDVIAGVGHVRLCDRSSTGSVSPVEQVSRGADWISPQQPHKRSKNDNEEDDDVIFVSMESGTNSKSTFRSSPQKPFSGTAPGQGVKPPRKSKKDALRSNSAKTVSTLSVPTAGYFPQTMQAYSVVKAPPFHAPSSSGMTPSQSNMSCVNANSAFLTKGYYLRSTANVQKQSTDNNEKVSSSNPGDLAKYHTRSHQKRQLEISQSVQQTNQASVSNEKHMQEAVSYASSVPQSSVQEAAAKSTAMHVANSCDPSDRTRMIILNGARQKSSSSFSKIYDIKGKIGVGGGGVVYAGTRKADNVEVAIKRVPKEKVKRWGKLDGRVVPIEFELLHRAVKSGNKGVIKMFDWFERRSSYILVMERPQPVVDLFDYLNQHGAMPDATARKIFRQIVEAVRHCHANGVVHRDIKDENVLLNLHTSEAKLIDFGCGTFMKNEPYTEFAGTPEFYPPEWFTDRRYEGRRVDAWSLGVLLYTMVEAEVPFQKEEDIVRCQLRHKRLQGPNSSLCRHLIASMLLKDQSKRLGLEEVLQHPWLNSAECGDPSNAKLPFGPTSAEAPATTGASCQVAGNAPVPNTVPVPKQAIYSPVVVMQYNEGESAKGYSSSYISPSIPQSVVRSNECVVHS